MKNYDYEKIIKDIYKYRGVKPSKDKRYDFIPLRERRDYGEKGMDFIEQQLQSLKKEKKLPKDLDKSLKKRLKSTISSIINSIIKIRGK